MTSLVFLWLVMTDSEDHADVMQTRGIDHESYLLHNPLALSPLDIDALNFQPTKQAREYLRELQRVEAEPVHENLDPRSNRELSQYDGMPESITIPKADDHKCDTCGNYRRERIVHLRNRYYFVDACPNFATTCAFDYLSVGFESKEALVKHIAVQQSLQAA
jgi:hypothetical protein